MLSHDRDEELSLFLEMRRREKEHRAADSLFTGSDNVSINGALTTSLSQTTSSQLHLPRRTAAENFLYSENNKSDYDWLLTPPGTPQFEKESHRSVMNHQLDAPNSRPTVLKSRLGNCREDNNKPQASSFGLSSSSISEHRRPSSSGSSRTTSRPSTPTRRSTTPTTSITKPVTTKASTSRSSTPTSRATLTAARATTTSTSAPRTTTKTAGSARSTTPTRSITRPSSAPSKKPVSRPATPTSRPSTPTGPSSKAPSLGTSPTVKSSKPWKPPEMPDFSLEAPPNLRTTLPNRLVSGSRGRPGLASAPGSRSGSIERGSGPTSGSSGHPRRQSCSPSRGRAPIGNTNSSLTGIRGRAKANNSSIDSLSPVAMGNKMVERVVNMRKLGPPRLTEKSTSASNSLGYGRNLSKSSIDMALRHMDIRRGMTGDVRPLVKNVPASSMYSVRSRPASASSFPVATSSTVSSCEQNFDNINILCLDGNEAEIDDLLSEAKFTS